MSNLTSSTICKYQQYDDFWMVKENQMANLTHLRDDLCLFNAINVQYKYFLDQISCILIQNNTTKNIEDMTTSSCNGERLLSTFKLSLMLHNCMVVFELEMDFVNYLRDKTY